jgi:hypothetical protein
VGMCLHCEKIDGENMSRSVDNDAIAIANMVNYNIGCLRMCTGYMIINLKKSQVCFGALVNLTFALEASKFSFRFGESINDSVCSSSLPSTAPDVARRLDLTADSGSGAVSGLGDTDGGRVGPGVLPHRIQLGVLSRVRDERSTLGEFTTANDKQ